MKRLWLLSAVLLLVLITCTYPVFTTWSTGEASFTVHMENIFGRNEHLADMIFFGAVYAVSVFVLVFTFGRSK